MSIGLMMPSYHFILCCPLLLLSSIFPCIRVFSSESALHIRWPKYWVFSFSVGHSSKYSGLISIRIDWFDLLVVHRTLKSLLQYNLKNISSSVLSLLYSPILTSVHDYWKKNIAFTIWSLFYWVLSFMNIGIMPVLFIFISQKSLKREKLEKTIPVNHISEHS